VIQTANFSPQSIQTTALQARTTVDQTAGLAMFRFDGLDIQHAENPMRTIFATLCGGRIERRRKQAGRDARRKVRLCISPSLL
jgi:hypothetical protein